MRLGLRRYVATNYFYQFSLTTNVALSCCLGINANKGDKTKFDAEIRFGGILVGRAFFSNNLHIWLMIA